MHKSCMKMPSDVEKDYNECVKKCKKYCDFWTYTIADVQSQKFNPEISDRFLTTNPSELDSRYYIRLLYQHGRYTHTEQAYKITFIEFIANIGGMSIMSLFQIFLYLLMAKVGNLQRRKSNRKSNSKQDYQNDENQFNDESSTMIEELRSSA
uniref:Uncharacterized protein n=1 Tax=Acrobeloides nanus TaxID=290746 RepID=A0A914EC12_9BILA